MGSAEIEKHIAHLEYYNTLCEKTSGTSVAGIKINYNDKGLNIGKTGSISINTDQFLNNEKKFLLQGEEQFYKFPVKTSAGPRSKPAETAEEKELYLKLEANRKKACLKYYN